MVIDFREITHDHIFENFCAQLLESMNFRIHVPPAIGPDSGRDLLCEEPSRFGTNGYRWLVSCKHQAISGKPIGVNDDHAKPHKLDEHGCHGFLFFFSTAYTEGFRASVENICSRKNLEYKIFNNHDIERILLSSASFYPLILQYFPQSHDRLFVLSNNNICDDHLAAQDSVYAVYTASQDQQGKYVYETVGECCISNYLDHLDENRIKYGWVKIRDGDLF